MYFNPQQFGPLVHERIKELHRQAEVEHELRKRNEPLQTLSAPQPLQLKTKSKFDAAA
jgi:hypothetical protein